MKNVFKFTLAALFAATLAFSCQKSINEPQLGLDPQTGMITVQCTISTPDTKVSLTNDGTVGKTAWEDGDEVFFHGAFVGTSGDNVYSCVATAHDISSDGKTASFTIPEIAKRFNPTEISWRKTNLVTDLYAVYPASAVSDFTNGAEWYFVSSFKETNHLLLAGCNDTRDGGNTFTFMNLTGALSFKVNDAAFADGFDAYLVSGNNNETVGYTNYCVKMDIDINSSNPNDFRTLYVGSDGPGPSSGEQKTILVENWDGADGITNNTVYFPNGANFTKGFTIKFLKNGVEVQRASTSSSANVAVGKLLDLGDITDHLYTYVPPASHDATHPAITGAADLGGAGTANCYVLNGGDPGIKNKVFKFKAVQGNSTSGVGKIESVEVLWETWNNGESVTVNSVIAEVDYDKQDGDDDYWITFKMPETLHPGNAVIAAKDALSNILWSWHIWVPADTNDPTDGGLGGDVWMDRNLGALTAATASDTDEVAPSSFGLFYSWGRKDPFPGLASFSSSSLATTTGSFNMSGSQMTISASIVAPTTFVSTGSDSNYPWTTDDTAGLWNATAKTIYDPCPPGYVVPAFTNGAGLWAGKDAAGFTVDATHKWVKFGDPSIVFPIVGYIDATPNPAKNANRGARLTIWSSTNTSTAGLSYDLRVNTDGSSSNEWQRQARALSVRCVVE